MTAGSGPHPRAAEPAPPAWVAEACGEAPLSAQPARWGFRHETWVVRLPGDRRLVVQRRAAGSDPTQAAAREIRDRIRTAGLAVPEPLAAMRIAGAAVVVLPWVEGVVAADLLGTPEDAETAGRACGEVAARLAAIDPAGLVLPGAGAPSADVRPRDLRLAHGDLAPVNVLVTGGRPVAVLDLDRARLAHPGYDAAWFGWVTAFHHPGVADAAWAGFEAAARLDPGAIRSLAWLWPLQLAERVAEARDDAERATWSRRLADRTGA